jgi:uncharacterized protein
LIFWIVAGTAAFLLGLSKGGIPVVAVLSVPLLSTLMDPAMAAGLLLPLYITADVYAVYLFRRDFSVRNLKILLPSAVIGVLGGFFAISYVSSDVIKLLLSGIGFWYLTTSLRTRLSNRSSIAKPAHAGKGMFWGSLAGLTSYIAHAGAPPYQAYVLPQRLEKMTYLGTTTIFFTCVNLMKLPAFILAGQVTWEGLSLAVWIAPVALLGAWSGAKISRWLPERVFFILVEVALGLLSLMLLYDAFNGLAFV